MTTLRWPRAIPLLAMVVLVGGCSSSAPSADSRAKAGADASLQDTQADVASPDTGLDIPASDIAGDAPGDQGAGDSMVDIRVDLRRDALPTDTQALDTRPADICRINACGGCTTLAAKPGDPCGLCGVWRCDGADKVGCDHRVNKITFLAPVGVPAVNTAADEVAPTLSPNAHVLYFERGGELWLASRQVSGPYQVVTRVLDAHGNTPITGYQQFSLRSDQGALFASHATTGLIYLFKRNNGPFDAAMILDISPVKGALNLSAPHASPEIHARVNTYSQLYYASTSAGGAGGLDLLVAEQLPGSTPFPFAVGTLLTPLNSSADDDGPAITSDGLTLFFASTRVGGVGGADLYFAVRASRAHPFSAPVNVTVNSTSNEKEPAILLGSRTLYFQSDRVGGQGGWDIWKSQVVCK